MDREEIEGVECMRESGIGLVAGRVCGIETERESGRVDRCGYSMGRVEGGNRDGLWMKVDWVIGGKSK